MALTHSNGSKQRRSDWVDRLPAWLRFILYWYWAAFAAVAVSYVVGGILVLIQNGWDAAFRYFTSWALLAPIASKYPQLFVGALIGLMALAVVSFTIYLRERERKHQTGIEKVILRLQPNDPTPPKVREQAVFKVPDSYFLFTGRQALLEDLHRKFNNDDGVATTHILAISGLGGMGKTQTAIEYAHRYHSEYKTVLWAKADAPENLRSAFLEFAGDLDLPEKDNKNPQRVVDAVKEWLRSNPGWLLIFDNADDPEVVEDFLPRPNRGHTLLTTRATAVQRIADPVEIPPMDEDEGTRFLLRRAGIHEPTADDQGFAREIVREMGGLPLALEQAGAYIEETQGSLLEYLENYQTHRADLLNQRKPRDYPFPVATTWLLSSKVQGANPASLELLRLCAFLDPDAMPEEMFKFNEVEEGIQALGPILGPISSDQVMMDAIFAALSRFSLVRRNSNAKTLTIHRLVQAVIQDDMDEASRRVWAERATRVVNHVFPDDVTRIETWNQCQRCLPQALACATLMKNYGLSSPEAARLLNQAGTYLRVQARFTGAEPLLQQALDLRKREQGEAHPSTAQSYDALARLYFDQYRYGEAEALYRQALSILQQDLEQAKGQGEQDLEQRLKGIADTLNRLALTRWYRGQTEERIRDASNQEADVLYQEALTIVMDLPVTQNLTRLTVLQLKLNILNNQALLYRSQGRHDDAISAHQQVLEERRAILAEGLADPARKDKPRNEFLDVAASLQNLAVDYYRQASKGEMIRLAEAEGLLKEALTIRETEYNSKDPQIARCLGYLGLVYYDQGKEEDAEQCFKRALEIWGKSNVEGPQVKEVRQRYEALLLKQERKTNDVEAAIKPDQNTRLN